MEITKINATKLLVNDVVTTRDKTASGIFIPTEVVKVNSMKGKIILVGSGTPDITIHYAVGDTVVFHPQAGAKFTFEDKEYRLIDVNDVLLGGVE